MHDYASSSEDKSQIQKIAYMLCYSLRSTEKMELRMQLNHLASSRDMGLISNRDHCLTLKKQFISSRKVQPAEPPKDVLHSYHYWPKMIMMIYSS